MISSPITDVQSKSMSDNVGEIYGRSPQCKAGASRQQQRLKWTVSSLICTACAAAIVQPGKNPSSVDHQQSHLKCMRQADLLCLHITSPRKPLQDLHCCTRVLQHICVHSCKNQDQHLHRDTHFSAMMRHVAPSTSQPIGASAWTQILLGKRP